MENIISRIRRCSFCRSPNHNILSCDDPLLFDFQQNLFQKKQEILNIQGTSLYEKIALFESWVLYQCMFGNSFILKAYAVRYLGCTTRDRINIYFQKISNFIWSNELNLINERNSVSENQEMEEEVGLEWYIDRTGDPNLLPIQEVTNINIIMEDLYNSLNIDLFKKEECSICYECIEVKNIVKLNCFHEFCGCCVKKIIHSEIKKCAFCRKTIDCIKVKNKEMESFLKN